MLLQASHPRLEPFDLLGVLDLLVQHCVIDLGNLQDGNQELNLPPEQSDAYVLKDLPRWRDMLQGAGIEAA